MRREHVQNHRFATCGRRRGRQREGVPQWDEIDILQVQVVCVEVRVGGGKGPNLTGDG
jgi:hypothetical protein